MEADHSQFWTFDRIWRAKWLVVALSLAGLALGVAAGYYYPQTFKAEARLTVGSGSLSDLVIPGFPTASAQLAANYSRFVDNKGLITGAERGLDSVDASPFPDSNVIRIETVSGSRSDAISGAEALAEDLMVEVNRVAADNDSAEVLEEFTARAAVSDRAQLRSDSLRNALARLNEDDSDATPQQIKRARREFLAANSDFLNKQLVRDALQDRYRRLVSTRSTEANLSLVGDGAYISEASRTSQMERFGLVGLLLGAGASAVAIRLRSKAR